MANIFKDEFVPNIQSHSKTSYATWKAANPNEAKKWEAFRDAVIAWNGSGTPPSAPTLATRYGKALVAAGKLQVSVTDIGADYGTPTQPPPNPTFGSSLPPRLPESAGATYNVSTVAQLQSAVDTVPNGSIINITQSLNFNNTVWRPQRVAAPNAPITIKGNPGVIISNNLVWEITRGAYQRYRGLEFAGCVDTIKPTSYPATEFSHDIEIDQCLFHNNTGQGMFVGSEQAPYTRNIQVWNSKFWLNGDELNYDHNLYWDSTEPGSQNVIANCLFYDGWAYNMQIFPQARDLIVTCCTVDGGQIQPNQRGGVVFGTDDLHISKGTPTTRITFVGTIVSNAPTSAGFHFAGVDAGFRSPVSPNNIYDCMSYNNAGGGFDTDAAVTVTRPSTSNPLYVNRTTHDYRLQSTSPAISYVDPSRYGYVPITDINGNIRVTADAGCYAKEAAVA